MFSLCSVYISIWDAYPWQQIMDVKIASWYVDEFVISPITVLCMGKHDYDEQMPGIDEHFLTWWSCHDSGL